ncbi:Ig-like domain-containing protein [Nocardiopsis sediminis]|uniref:Ig-like domain-containing protein n=1 Tax=Nocardiopsis sediminis TaxID=1778267 RepID=A0ABV8FTL6_9ACTN
MKGSTSTAGYRSVGAGAAGSAIILTAACTSLWAGATGTGDGGDPVAIEITPADGTGDARSNVPITVGAANGTITDVRVEQAGGGPDGDIPARLGVEPEGADGDRYAMTGVLNKARTEWVSDWNLVPGADVTVTATGVNDDGAETEVVSRFSTEPTAKGKGLDLESNFPAGGQTVGVGMPVIVNFDLPVENKEQVENSIEVTSEKPAQGAWNWFGDTMAVFRPEKYWEPDQKVSVDMRLAGVEASPGVVGTQNRRLDFQVGREQITTVDDDAHEMTVRRDGETVKTFPISNGRGDTERYTTTNGIHLTMEKYEDMVMDSSTVGVPAGSAEAYRLDVSWAVRFSNSGEFAHAAPWNGNVGSANTSHGCTNMSTEDAKWFHDETLMGDPYIVEGTERELEVDNGWGFWQRSWDDWLANSPTGEPDATTEAGTPGSVHGAA